MIKESVLWEHIPILNLYASNNRTSKYMSEKLNIKIHEGKTDIQGEVDKIH